MLNRYFDDEALTVLLRPAAWQVAGGHGLAEIEPVRDEVHERWLREHHHAHSYTEVCLMLAGDGRHACAGPVYPFGAGTVYCFLPGDTHDEEPPPHLAYNRQLWFRVQQEVVMAGLIEVRDGAWSRPWARSVILARPELGWTDCRRPFASLADPALPVAIRRMQLRAAVMQLVAATLTAGYQPDDLVDGESFQGQVISTARPGRSASAFSRRRLPM